MDNPEIRERVDKAELVNILKKVQSGAILTTPERRRLAELTESQEPPPASMGAWPRDTVPPQEAEEVGTEKVSRDGMVARVEVMAEWVTDGYETMEIYHLAAKRWGIGRRATDYVLSRARRYMSDPKRISFLVNQSLHAKRLTKLYRRRMEGLEDRDPMEPLKELAKIFGVYAPEKSQQAVSVTGNMQAMPVWIPDNGRDTQEPETTTTDHGRDPETPGRTPTGVPGDQG